MARPSRHSQRAIQLGVTALACWIAWTLVPAGVLAISVGDPAPPFQMQGSDGAAYSLESVLAEHEGVVLAWFPKAFTPG
ncbi:MAG: redoxin domain-containing protein [Deltaproteobacteria bacterium]|nr:redoxin domain-containing protein [Deltaproteobacteria bacterium]MBW2383108.1 redoxin domain-containing protein [Deltaproteobacteria bacterium]MBW2698042.1 redoxin domain-containing protein [Deltaproteobacteria bacterium]